MAVIDDVGKPVLPAGSVPVERSGDLADDLATRVVGATDNSIYQILPQAIVYPRTRDDVVLLMKIGAQEPFSALTFTARGGGTGTNGQSLTSGIVVDVGRHMNRISPPGSGGFPCNHRWVRYHKQRGHLP